MGKAKERRQEERLSYQLPVWFGEHSDHLDSQGEMVDISTGGVAFTYESEGNCPSVGQELTARFSLPRTGVEESSDSTVTFMRSGRVCRVEMVRSNLCRVAIQFEEPPPFWNAPPSQGG